jgi:uncharacterized membrane protein YcaP (DUF421 family)
MHSMIPDMFHLALPVMEKVARPIAVYVFLVIVLRIFGKRELAQLNPFDLVVLLTLSNTVQNAIIGDDNSVTGGMIGAFTLVFVNYLVVRFLFGHRRLDQIVEGKPTELVRNGKPIKKNLAKELITIAELEVVARRQGFSAIHELRSCILEPGGTFVMEPIDPPPEEKKHEELVGKLDQLMNEVRELRLRLGTAES